MTREIVATEGAPAAIGPYSQGVRAAGLFFSSGQIALDPETGALVGSNVEEETERVFQNLEAVLEAAGSSLAKVVRCTVYLKDMGEFARVNEVYGRWFEGADPPARACVEVAALPKGARVEIDCIALL